MIMGFMYIAFGKNAAKAAGNSLASIRRTGNDFPATSVGDTPVEGTTFIPWLGHRPWTDDETDLDQRFRAGYVKPHIYNLSPYVYTLYLDADTVIKRDIMPGFWALRDNDICVVHYDALRTFTMSALKKHMDRSVFNIPYYENIRKELDYTIGVIGKDTSIVNSGVIFFRKSIETSSFFNQWFLEWLHFRGWEEQLAFLRAEHKTKNLKVKKLPLEWNHKRVQSNTIIWHKMGAGSARNPE